MRLTREQLLDRLESIINEPPVYPDLDHQVAFRFGQVRGLVEFERALDSEVSA